MEFSCWTSRDHSPIVIHVGQLHAGRLHLWIGETHLHVNVVDGLQEVAEVSPCGADHLVVAKVAEESHETAPEEVHAEVEGLARAGGQSLGDIRHQLVRIDLVRLEAIVLAVDDVTHLPPNVHAILLLHVVLHTLIQHSIHGLCF